VPNKNIRLFGGKPLIVHAIDMAKSIKSIDKIFVSTEDKVISNISVRASATVIPRPNELAKDDSPEFLAWQHAISWVRERFGEFDRFVSLPTTAPLRKKSDVENCLVELKEDVDLIVTVTESLRNPWFNMVEIDRDGNAKLLISDGKDYMRAQDAPKSFDMTTVAYVSRPNFISSAKHLFAGKVRTVCIPPERSIDIDTELDLKIAEYLYLHKDDNSEDGPDA